MSSNSELPARDGAGGGTAELREAINHAAVVVSHLHPRLSTAQATEIRTAWERVYAAAAVQDRALDALRAAVQQLHPDDREGAGIVEISLSEWRELRSAITALLDGRTAP